VVKDAGEATTRTSPSPSDPPPCGQGARERVRFRGGPGVAPGGTPAPPRPLPPVRASLGHQPHPTAQMIRETWKEAARSAVRGPLDVCWRSPSRLEEIARRRTLNGGGSASWAACPCSAPRASSCPRSCAGWIHSFIAASNVARAGGSGPSRFFPHIPNNTMHHERAPRSTSGGWRAGPSRPARGCPSTHFIETWRDFPPAAC
jgi:hypothetical protein